MVDASDGRLTDAEHHARAMLLGMTYYRRGRYYVTRVTPSPLRLDANTLEPITLQEVFARHKFGVIRKEND